MTSTIQLGLLGNGIGRSRVKSLHEFLGDFYDLPVKYELIDLAEESQPVKIEEYLADCRSKGFRGVNVTHPYKREAFGHVETLEGFPQGLIAVNTVVFAEQGYNADNTDFSGMYHALKSNLGGESFKPGRVLMLGSGGVGLAIGFALLRLGAKELVIYDRNVATARILESQLADCDLPVRVIEGGVAEEMQRADGLINATPLGMYQYPGCAFPDEGFGQSSWAFDAVYTPQKTEFLQKCAAHNMQTVSGLELFLYQGFDAFERFTDVKVVPEDVLPELRLRYAEPDSSV